MVTYISAAAPKNWNAAAWLLERKFPEEFGRHRLEITGENGAQIQVGVDVDAEIADKLRHSKAGHAIIWDAIEYAAADNTRKPDR